MTQKEFYQAVAKRELTDEVVTYAKTRYDKLAAPTEAQLESARVSKAIFDDEALVSFSSSEIAAKMECSTSRAANILKTLYEKGELTREMDVKDKRYVYLKRRH